jgi:ribosomal protein S27E
MVMCQEYQQLMIEHIDEDIALAPMPEEYRSKRVRVRCNECRQESVTAFHVFGLKCRVENSACGGSYNTVKIDEEVEAEE